MQRSRRLLLAGAGLALAGVVAWSAVTTGATAQDKVTFRMNWAWGGIHAPFALAKERGYFEKAGVNVEILEGSLVDDDGECTAGNFVWRRPGSVHRAWSPNGCIGIGIFERPNEFLEEPDRS